MIDWVIREWKTDRVAYAVWTGWTLTHLVDEKLEATRHLEGNSAEFC
jgi:hypothetical protein